MDNIIKKLMSYEKVDMIYSTSIFTIKQISEHLEIWNTFTEQQKSKLEDLTEEESFQLSITLSDLSDEERKKFIQHNWNKEDKSYSLGYGEVSKKGVEKLNNYIENNIQENNVFYDLGSGNGKLALHMSLISNFDLIKGVEFDNIRFLYSESVKKNIGNFDNVYFYNDSFLDMDLSDASVVFMNDVLFSENLVTKILENLNKGTHLISFNNQLYFPCYEKHTYIDSFNIDVSWMDLPVTFNHYII